MTARSWTVISASVFIGAAIVLPFIGPSALDLIAVWQRQDPDWSIFMQLRVSRTVLGLFVGATLFALGYRIFMGWVAADRMPEATIVDDSPRSSLAIDRTGPAPL